MTPQFANHVIRLALESGLTFELPPDKLLMFAAKLLSVTPAQMAHADALEEPVQGPESN